MQHQQLIDRRVSMETVEMDACVSVYSGQSDGLPGRSCSADVAAIINLDADEDVDSLDSSPVCTLTVIAVKVA